MELGIIGVPTEETFRAAQKRGLDFLEFCINCGQNVDEFIGNLDNIKRWSETYCVRVGSIGRWKTNKIDKTGNIIEEELQISYKLINAAEFLKCNNFVCGCNYISELSYFDNCKASIDFFTKLLDYAANKGVKVSTYNCRKVNFVCNPMAWTMIHGHLPSLGIKYDPSHSRYAGDNYLKETCDWAHRFYHIHLKGSLIVDGSRIDDPPVGLDQTDWASFINILRSKCYNGGLSIEPHSTVWCGDLGERGTDYSINYMNSLLLR